MSTKPTSHTTQVGDTQIHYLSAGEGKEVILLVHGWPTAAYLWRNILSELGDAYRVIAIDLPGFGKSDKRLEDSYSFRYYKRILNGFLENLGIETLTLGVHDLGGPIGVHWALNHMDKVNRLILFNTLVYPKFSFMVKVFGLAVRLPLIRNWISSPKGIRWAMFFGVHQKHMLTDEIISNYQAPFQDAASRKALLKTAQRLSLKGFQEIEEKLKLFKGPVQIIYGEKDKILPKVAETMKRVKEDLPQAQVHVLPNSGHFLQEESSEEIGRLLREFMVGGSD